MTIRRRLTLWYGGILFTSMLLITFVEYREFKDHPTEAKSSDQKVTEEDELDDAVGIVIWCGLPAALVGVAGGWWLTKKALAPVTALTAAAARIHEGNLTEQLPRTGNGDELDQLTEVFNAMTMRLHDSFNRIREFTLHASHELKTPLTVMRGEVETALQEGYAAGRESLLSQLDEIQRLTNIVNGLALLTKADAGLIQLKREAVPLHELVKDSFDDAQILGQPKRIQVELKECAAVTVRGDRHRLRQLLLNLTDNAVKYNTPDGKVLIALRETGGRAELTISNTGPGIPAELRGRVFERFFRGDASHNNEVEGCGLGLSVAQWIAQAHDGAIGIESKPAEWTTVTVRLPVAGKGA